MFSDLSKRTYVCEFSYRFFFFFNIFIVAVKRPNEMYEDLYFEAYHREYPSTRMMFRKVFVENVEIIKLTFILIFVCPAEFTPSALVYSPSNPKFNLPDESTVNK